MVTIYTVTYNEELLVQFMIDHYRTRFPGCKIVVNDNLSTDNTAKIARDNNCEVVFTDTKGQHRESHLLNVKNNSWKSANTDWVLTCDLDELLEINLEDLNEEERLGTTIIKTEGYDMVAMDNELNIPGIKYGVRDEGEDKSVLFNKKFIKEINFDIGAHNCNPVGTAQYSNKVYKLFNYCYINYDVTVKRYKTFWERKRKSPEDMILGLVNNSESPEEIRKLYWDARRKAVKLR